MALIKIKRLKTKNMFNPLKYKKAMDKRVPMILNLAADIIVDDIERGITYGRDIDGRPFKPLKPATIKNKRKTKSKTPRIALSDKGIMKKTYIKKKARATRGSLNVIISVPQKRLNPNVARFHHEGEGNNPQRKWFGVSLTAINRIRRELHLVMAKELRNHWGLR